MHGLSGGCEIGGLCEGLRGVLVGAGEKGCQLSQLFGCEVGKVQGKVSSHCGCGRLQ